MEIKLRVSNFEDVSFYARNLARDRPRFSQQKTTFYSTRAGPLGLRQFSRASDWCEEDGVTRWEITLYSEADSFHRLNTSDPEKISELSSIFRITYGPPVCIVERQRLLWIVATRPNCDGCFVRVCLDRIEGLGDFAKLSAIEESFRTPAEGAAAVTQVRSWLGLDQFGRTRGPVERAELVEGSYSELLRGMTRPKS